MGRSFRNLGYKFIVAVIIFAVLEAGVVIRWLLFHGPVPSVRDLEAGVATVVLIWLFSKIAAWFETRDRHHKEIFTRIRDIDTRLEALYKWGGIVSDDGEDDDDLENEELDDSTKAKIAKCSEEIEQGSGSRYNLGVTYWNLAMDHYNTRTESGYRKAIFWLRKAAKQDYNCEGTLGDAYHALKDYDKAIHWYLRSVKRGGSLVWIPESDIGDMYEKGEGVTQNYAEAARWWTRSAQHGSYWSHYSLGKLYAEGADGVEKDKDKAYFHLYVASCDTGEHGSQKSAIEPLAKVAKELGEYFAAQEKKRAEEWLAAHKQKTKNSVKPLPLPQ